MKVYVQSYPNSIPHNYNFMNAYQGFKEMGFETVLFSEPEVLRQSNKEDVIVGYVETVRQRLRDFGIEPEEMDYPEELQKYMGRKVWHTKMSAVNNNPQC